MGTVTPRLWHVGAWPRRLRRALALVLVVNVALGMAFSIIGLRRQADRRAQLQLQVSSWLADTDAVEGEVWRAIVGDGTGATPATARWMADQATVARTLSGVGGQTRSAATAFTAAARQAHAALAAGDYTGARRAAAVLDQRLTALQTDLRRVAASRRHESADANRIADVETVVLMLFAAGVGLLLFRRAVAARLNGERRAAHERTRAQARFASLVRHSSDLISIVEIDSTIVFQTDSVRAVLGHDTATLAGTALFDLVHDEDRARMVAAHDALLDGAELVSTTVRMRAADGGWRHVESAHHDLRDDPTVAGVVVTSRDVTDRVTLESQLRHSAFHDDLTGLANRALFTDRLEHALARGASAGAEPVVVFLDLDDFKAVNDTLGHAVGDRLLCVVAERLRAAVRAADTVARLGGDEFAVLCEDVSTTDRDAMLERVLAALREPVELEGHPLSVHASIGIAHAGPGQGVGTVLANADLAMYAAKGSGKDTVVAFTPDLAEQAVVRLQLKSELHAALATGQIRAHFQPTVTLTNGRISGFEALARWEHPDRGTVMPSDFIPIAEQTGQIVDIGRTVLRQACAMLVRWHQQRPDYAHLTMSVNLSARELEEPDLIEVVARALSDTGLAAERLTLEVTESLLVADPAGAKRQLAGLRDLGVRIAIDDFGTGYSSLGYLEQLPVDVVKIDKSFVDRLAVGQPSVVVDTITQLASALGLLTVAEGIEQSEQADLLLDIGCDLGQGYLYSRPVPVAAVEELLAALPVERVLHPVESHRRPPLTPPDSQADVA